MVSFHVFFREGRSTKHSSQHWPNIFLNDVIPWMLWGSTELRTREAHGEHSEVLISGARRSGRNRV